MGVHTNFGETPEWLKPDWSGRDSRSGGRSADLALRPCPIASPPGSDRSTS